MPLPMFLLAPVTSATRPSRTRAIGPPGVTAGDRDDPTTAADVVVRDIAYAVLKSKTGPMPDPPPDPLVDGRTHRERMLAGDLYLADDPEIVAESLRARRLQDAFNRTLADESDERRRILGELLG